MPTDGSSPPRIFSVVGLPGIGRRTLIRHTVPDLLNLKRFITINVEDSVSIHDVAIELASQITPFSTVAGFNRVVQEIRALSPEEATTRALEDMRAIVKGGELPIFVDSGGLIEVQTGRLNAPLDALFRRLSPNDDAYFAIVSNRAFSEPPIPTMRVDALPADDVKRLLIAVAQHASLTLTPKHLAELSEYVSGYPPSVYYAIKMAKDYGLDLVLADKNRLVSFRTGFFIEHLKKLGIADDHLRVLKLLTTYSPLPLRTIGESLKLAPEVLADSLIWLRDRALITIDMDGNYSIASPVSDAVNRIIGFTGESEARAVVQSLTQILEESTEGEIPKPSVLRVLYRARAGTGDPDAFDAFHYNSDIIRLCKEFYDRREYERALDFARIAVNELPRSIEANSYLIRALIQEEAWTEAQDAIDGARGIIPERDIHYLRGFLLRKQGDSKQAISEYEQSIKHGRRGAAIHRELAQCYTDTGNSEKANIHIHEALRVQPENRFVLDLWASISAQRNDESQAREALSRLKTVEAAPFYLHRLATIELHFGTAENAYKAANEAVGTSLKPTFEMRALLVQASIRTKRFDQAEAILTELDRSKKRADIRLGLRCRLQIEQQRFREALATSEEIRDKERPVYKLMRRDALAGELRSSALPDDRRLQYQTELGELEKELSLLQAHHEFLIDGD